MGFLCQHPFPGILVSVPIAVKEHFDHKQPSRSDMEASHGRSSIWRHELKQNASRDAADWLAPYTF